MCLIVSGGHGSLTGTATVRSQEGSVCRRHGSFDRSKEGSRCQGHGPYGQDSTFNSPEPGARGGREIESWGSD